MSTDVVSQTELDRLYNKGYDDGYDGDAKAGTEPDYLQGYYDGQQEAEEADSYDDGVYSTYWDYEDGDED